MFDASFNDFDASFNEFNTSSAKKYIPEDTFQRLPTKDAQPVSI
jgi:hypothetical protein